MAGRTSSFSYKGKNEDLRVIGTTLGVANVLTSPLVLGLLCVAVAAAGLSFAANRDRWGKWHDLIEQNGLAFTVLVLVAILIGGVVQIIPTVVISGKVPAQVAAYQEAKAIAAARVSW